VRGWSFADNSAQQKDGNGHGTHLMGMLAAMHNNALGISSPWRGFKILPVQIFSGAHPSVSTEKIFEAIRYAVDMGASVISASFGTPSFSEIILEAVRYAEQHNVVFVSAVGNFRKNLNVETNFPSGFGLANQIAVGASDNRDLAASFSNFGNSVDIYAPGENIVSLSLKEQYASRSGTSQACPLVAATAAMVRAINPELTAPQVKERLLDAADEKSGLVGFAASPKRINVANALSGALGARLQRFEFSEWNTVAVDVQSEHPYRNNKEVRYLISAPLDTRFFRIHFSRIQTESSDTITLITATGEALALYSGGVGEMWSPVISGSAAAIVFKTNEFVFDWGFAVDKLEIEPVSPNQN
jgi:subtilisin family serine protease